MFWLFIAVALVFVFRKEIFSYLKNLARNFDCCCMPLYGIVIMVVMIVFLLVFLFDITPCGMERERQENASELVVTDTIPNVVVPDGYELIPLVVKGRNISCDSHIIVTFYNGKKIILDYDKDKDWKHVRKGDVCSYVRKYNEQGVLIKDEVFPVAPQFVCFDTKKGTVSYYN